MVVGHYTQDSDCLLPEHALDACQTLHNHLFKAERPPSEEQDQHQTSEQNHG